MKLDKACQWAVQPVAPLQAGRRCTATMRFVRFLPPYQYRQENRKLYEEHKVQILEALPLARVEQHIGASAIPGAYSKGDLDILVGVPRDDMENSIEAMELLGFHRK